jgi:hypothetical protein
MKLTDTQLVILSAASQRPDRAILPLPAEMEEAVATKAVRLLLKKKLVTEAVIEGGTNGLVVHRTDKHGTRYGLVVSDRGLAALGAEPDDAPQGDYPPAEATPAAASAQAPAKKARGAKRVAAKPAPKPRRGSPPAQEQATRPPREGTKQAKLIAMLRRPDGATVAQIAKATGWQHHTVRGAIAGALKKKLGLTIATDKNKAGARVYRIAG